MQEDIIISGFGGQGVLFAGQLLAYAAMDQGKEVTWIPSYGPEMRGGTAHCTVVISDEPIGSPIVRQPTIAIAMNLPSLTKYGGLLRSGGLLVVNSSLAPDSAGRADIREVRIPASEIAGSLGDVRMSNVVLLGALMRWTSVLSVVALEAAMDAHVGGRARRLLVQNKEALHKGYAAAG
jgi:2-oxoglutarate ferredoxin oxidoreductase subunit gamma